jgi:hypothetical protein
MNVILTHGCNEYSQAVMCDVNNALDDSHTPFTRVPASDSEYVGGEKNMECDVYLAAFNYMPLEHLLAAIRGARWNRPEHVQVFVKDEDEERFTERDWRSQGEPCNASTTAITT